MKAPPTTSTQTVRPSRSRRSPTPTAPSRILRYTRLLFYLIAAPLFLYSFYVQVFVLKGPGRKPLPASVGFGRDTVFLTFHGNFHCTWYACLCLLHAFLALGARRRGRAARTVEVTVHRFTPILFPLNAFVGLAYYLILHYHPMNRLRAQLVPDHDSKMALLHLNPLLFVLGDSLLKDADLFMKHGMRKPRAVRVITTYGVCYFFWTLLCARLNGGHWPYPFLQKFSAVQHVMFVLFCVLIAVYLTKVGFRMHARIDRRRRRRLAMKAENNRRSFERSSSKTSLDGKRERRSLSEGQVGGDRVARSVKG